MASRAERNARDVVKRINDGLVVIAKIDDVRERLRDLGLAAQSDTPQQRGELMRSRSEKVTRIVENAGIALE